MSEAITMVALRETITSMELDSNTGAVMIECF